jgi:Undecaprenyl-phosphate glucose phosphotransferase
MDGISPDERVLRASANGTAQLPAAPGRRSRASAATRRPTRPIAWSESIVSGLIGAGDALILTTTGVVAHGFLQPVAPIDAAWLCGIVIHAGLTLTLFKYAGLYDCTTILSWPHRMRQLILLSALVTLTMLVPAIALRIPLGAAGYGILCSATACTAAMVGVRGGAALLIRRLAAAGLLTRTVAIVGAGAQAQRLASRLHLQDAPLRRIIGVFDDRQTRIEHAIRGLPLLGCVADLGPYVRSGIVHDVIIALPWHAEARIASVVRTLKALPVHIYLSPDLIGYGCAHNADASGHDAPLTRVAAAPLAGWGGLFKSVLDKILAAVLGLVLSPLLLLVALVIRLESPGPALFRQCRYGFNNRPIVIYKFRTMWHHRPPETGVPQARRNDPRVTRFGRLLRSSSLDELPQLLNVLQGNMSLVGPRPHAVAHNELYARLIDGYDSRHNVKPGITGWAQIHGYRGETDTLEKMQARLTHDIFYIDNWSLRLDIRILLRTAMCVWTQRSAY